LWINVSQSVTIHYSLMLSYYINRTKDLKLQNP